MELFLYNDSPDLLHNMPNIIIIQPPVSNGAQLGSEPNLSVSCNNRKGNGYPQVSHNH